MILNNLISRVAVFRITGPTEPRTVEVNPFSFCRVELPAHSVFIVAADSDGPFEPIANEDVPGDGMVSYLTHLDPPENVLFVTAPQ